MGTDPWFHTPFGTVAENGCENCHNPHNAEGNKRLMNYLHEENNCLHCHNGNVAATDIYAEASKTFAHNIFGYNGIHDPQEPNVVQSLHVECEDCHNPHAVRNAAALPPAANGFIAGLKGVDTHGNDIDPIQNQYELCYRCHADSPVLPPSPTSRLIEQNNTRLEFDLSNPSYHPVEGPGKNSDVPSLISPLTEASVIFCTDCHSSDGQSAPAGPHGSEKPQILKFRYETADNTPESYENYRLCYECHDRTVIINSIGNFGQRVHRKHIVSEDTPCNICHDPHGISGLQGNSTNNSHLINFESGVVTADPVTGRLEFVDNGNFRGRCYLRCHGENHSPEFYQ
jgi:predicted CXXCH cytochrome family protein